MNIYSLLFCLIFIDLWLIGFRVTTESYCRIVKELYFECFVRKIAYKQTLPNNFKTMIKDIFWFPKPKISVRLTIYILYIYFTIINSHSYVYVINSLVNICHKYILSDMDSERCCKVAMGANFIRLFQL